MKKIILHLAFMLFACSMFYSCSGVGKNGSNKTSNDSIDSVKIVADSIKKAEAAAPKYLVIQGTNVNLRVAPNLEAVRIRQFQTGDTCEIIEKGNKDTVNDDADFWYKVKRKNKEGWVFGAFTSLKQSAKPDKQKK